MWFPCCLSRSVPLKGPTRNLNSKRRKAEQSCISQKILYLALKSLIIITTMLKSYIKYVSRQLLVAKSAQHPVDKDQHYSMLSGDLMHVSQISTNDSLFFQLSPMPRALRLWSAPLCSPANCELCSLFGAWQVVHSSLSELPSQLVENEVMSKNAVDGARKVGLKWQRKPKQWAGRC